MSPFKTITNYCILNVLLVPLDATPVCRNHRSFFLLRVPSDVVLTARACSKRTWEKMFVSETDRLGYNRTWIEKCDLSPRIYFYLLLSNTERITTII